jgi:hypothetical protein
MKKECKNKQSTKRELGYKNNKKTKEIDLLIKYFLLISILLFLLIKLNFKL